MNTFPQKPEILIITDTNIFIDLENADLIDDFLKAGWGVATTDFVLTELDDLSLEKIKTYKVRIEELNGKEMEELENFRAQHNRISVVDISVLLLSEKLNGILLSGDRALVKLCTNRKKVVSHGILWVLEKMLEIKVITYKQAYEGLCKIVLEGARLPKEKVNEYLKKWKIEVDKRL